MQKLLWVTVSIVVLLFSLLVACSEKETHQETATAIATATATAKPTSEKSGPETTLRDLETIEDLKAKFNEDFGKTRLILLFSPT
ncbi:uncharacterized protein METZ01_LOCUS403387 [marine metagenome]|uniref:Uncharacterized protein n=1 Tax=marine metagenome TaxID=408172 RepID=A0A382VVK7_9ZZZZ